MSYKANNYHKRKRFQRNKNRNDPDDSSRATSNYQRLISNNSNKTDSNNYTSQNTPIILKYANGGETNLLTWQERIGTILLGRYGNSAKFFNGEAYKQSLPSRRVFDIVTDPSGIKRKVQESLWIEYIKEQTRLKDDRPKIWGDIESFMSKESLDAVKAKPEYEVLKTTFKVVSFLKLIKEVHRTEHAVRSSADAVADALEQFHSIKQNSDELLIDYKNRIIAAVERIETAMPSAKPDAKTVARKFTRSLDLNRFEDLVRQCRDDETKYETTLSAAHNQASQQCVALKGKLVPCETLRRGANIAGAAEIKGLSKKELKLVMAMRKDGQARDQPTDDKPNGKGRKRKADDDNVAAAASDNKKSNKSYEKNHNSNQGNDSKGCEICKRPNHTTDKCYHLKGCQDMIAQKREQRQQQFSPNSGGYQPQYQSNYGYGPAHQLQPGRQVMYSHNNGGNSTSTELNYGYPGRGNVMRPFNQS